MFNLKRATFLLLIVHLVFSAFSKSGHHLVALRAEPANGWRNILHVDNVLPDAMIFESPAQKLIFSDTATPSSMKFDFGSGRVAEGYIRITPDTKFNYHTGYGFDGSSATESPERTGDALTSDFITGKKPFYFFVRLPDGNYDVKVLLGDTKGTSATTVRVENRRLMLENVRTQYGKTITKTFTIHIRDSLIRHGEDVIDKIRLKPREAGYLHWDNMLTIEFNDSLPKVCAMEITPNNNAATIFLAGNSTVVDQDREPWAAWGQMFPRFLVPLKVVVANYAESGETLKAFKSERRLEKVWSMA